MKATNIDPADINRCNELMPENVRLAGSGNDYMGFAHPLPPEGAACDKPTEHPGEDHAWRRAMRPAVEWPNSAPTSKFQIGDKVQMPDTPFVLEVLEIGACGHDDCDNTETFRFSDPGGMGDDWMHSTEFHKV